MDIKKKCTLFSYQLFLYCLAFIALPRFLYSLVFQKKYRSNWRSKLGRGEIRLQRERGVPLIWLHAVSFGETRAIAALARQLKTEYPEAQFLVSSGTETGHAEAKQAIPFAEKHVYLPFDFPWAVKRVLEIAKPSLVILSETDLWLNFLAQAKKQGATILVVNGKLSERSLSLFLKIKPFAQALFGLCDHFCIQNALYGERLGKLGIPKEKWTVTGNLKLDQPLPFLSAQQILALKREAGMRPEDPVIVAGSTHGIEEEKLLRQFQVLWKTFPSLKVVLAPRHPARFEEVARLLKKAGIAFNRYSSIQSKQEPLQPSASCLLWDVMGKLQMGYQLADVAIVGGSFVKHVGGHNILEPSHFGIPVLFGPHMYKQKEFAELVLNARAGKQIVIEEVAEAAQELLWDRELKQAMGHAGQRLIDSNRGATARTMEMIKKNWR